MGIQHMEYKDLLARFNGFNSPYISISSSFSVAAGRISYSFAFVGPSISIDTACSSALLSLSLASSYTGSSGKTSLSSSVSMILSKNTSMTIRAAGMTSLDGRCKTLDISADGYGRAESCSTFFLSCRGNAGCCIIAAISSNQDGRSSSLTAPSGPSQSFLIRRCLDYAEYGPKNVSDIILHGTGTSLGDPIEVGALRQIFPDNSRVTLHAPKSTFGHAEPASGHIGSFCAIQAIQKQIRQLNPHLKNLNTHIIRIGASGFKAERETSGSSDMKPYKTLIGVSAFAFQGTNAHAIFLQHIDHHLTPMSSFILKRFRFWVFPLSIRGIMVMNCGTSRLLLDLQLNSVETSICYDHTIYNRSVVPFSLLLKASFAALMSLNEKHSEVFHATSNMMTIIDEDLLSLRINIQIGSDIELSSLSRRGPSHQVFTCYWRRTLSLDHNCTQEADQVLLKSLTLPYQHIFLSIGYLPKIKVPGLCSESGSLDCLLQVSSAISNQVQKIRYPVSLLCAILDYSEPSSEWAFGIIKNVVMDCIFCDYNSYKNENQCSKMANMCFKEGSEKKSTDMENSFVYRIYRVSDIAKKSITVTETLSGSKNLGRLLLSCTGAERRYRVRELDQKLVTVLQLLKEEKPSDFVLTTFENIVPNLASIYYPSIASRFTKSVARERGGVVAVARNNNETIHKFEDTGSSTGDEELSEKGGAIFVPQFDSMLFSANNKDAGQNIIETVPTLESHRQMTYNLVGGTGSIGLLLAIWLSKNAISNNSHVQICGKSGKIIKGFITISHLPLVTIVQGDQSIKEEAQVQSSSSLNCMKMSILLTGKTKDKYYGRMTPTDLRLTMAPKASCLKVMVDESHCEAVHLELVFSSMVATFFNVGQTNYSAANSMVNNLAKSIRLSGRNIRSIEWGPWTLGMAASLQESMSQQGLAMISPIIGLTILEEILLNHSKTVADAFIGAFAEKTDHRIISDLPMSKEYDVWVTVRSKTTKDIILDKIRESLTEVMGFLVSDEEQFMEAGLDSVGSIEFRNKLSSSLDIDMPPTVAFDYPSILAMADYIADYHSIYSNKNHAQLLPQKYKSEDKVIVKSMTSRLPKSRQIEVYFSRQDSQIYEDLVSQVPIERWDIEQYFDPNGKEFMSSYTRFAGFCETIFSFDRSMFGISNQEACWLDPQIRILLEDHGQHLNVNGDNNGIFIGCMYHEYISDIYQKQKAMPPSHAVLGNGPSYMAGRISYSYGLTGPSICTDTACSSSLVACQLASNSLHHRESNDHCVSGINLLLSPNTTSAICHLNALSLSGRCMTFSDNADGYGRAEGCVVIGLTTAQYSKIDFSPLCEIKGIGVNQDGRSSALTSPNGPAQTQLIKSTCFKADVNAVEVSIFSTHGTGTSLGDPIELNSLSSIFEGNSNFTLLASKACLGHGEGSAGLSGLLFALCPMSSDQSPPVVHLTNVNKFIEKTMSRWKSNNQLNRLVSPVVSPSLVSGCSSFGMSGINAHALLSAKEAGPKHPNRRTRAIYLRQMYRTVHLHTIRTISIKLPRVRFEIHEFRMATLRTGMPSSEVGLLMLLHAGEAAFETFQYELSGSGKFETPSICVQKCVQTSRMILGEAFMNSVITIVDGQCQIMDDSEIVWQGFILRYYSTSQRLNSSFLRNYIVSKAGLSIFAQPQTSYIERISQWDTSSVDCHVSNNILAFIALRQASESSSPVTIGALTYKNRNIDSNLGFLLLNKSGARIVYSKEESSIIEDYQHNVSEHIGEDLIYTADAYIDSSVSEGSIAHKNGILVKISRSSRCIQSVLAELFFVARNAECICIYGIPRIAAEGAVVPCVRSKRENLKQGYSSGFLRNALIELPDLNVFESTNCVQIQKQHSSGSSWSHGNVAVSMRMRKERIPSFSSNLTLLDYGLVISGGTGDIASSLADWWSIISTSLLYLYSRSGRFRDDGHNLTMQASMVVVQILDASTKQDSDILGEYYRQYSMKMNFFHASGTQVPAEMLRTNPTIARAVASPKAGSISTLISNTRPFGCGLLFSSISSVLGSKKNASYAAANAAMDSIAKLYCSEGLGVRSVQWGAWASIGMAARHANFSKERSLEIGMISIETGIISIENLLSNSYSSIIIVSPLTYWVNMAKFIRSVESFTQDIFSIPNKIVGKKDQIVSITNQLDANMKDHLLNIIREILDVDNLDMEKPLGEQGLESLSSLDLKSKLDSVLNAGSITVEELIVETPIGLIQKLCGEPSNVLGGIYQHAPKAIKAKMRMFCLPWAGGVSDNLFAHWSKIFPAFIEIYPVQIPGRGRQEGQTTITCLSDLSDHLTRTLPFDEMPYAVFGTCLGAIIGYDMIQKLELSGRRKPLLFMPAAVSPPDKYASLITKIYTPRKPIFRLHKRSIALKNEVTRRLEGWRSLPREEVLYAFEAGHFAGIEEMMASEKLFDKVAPMAISDIIMAINYVFDPSSKRISAPIVAFDGIRDNTIPEGYMKGWRTHTESSFKRILIDSNHYFVASHFLEVASKASEACLNALDINDPILPRRHSWVSDGISTVDKRGSIRNLNGKQRRSKRRIFIAALIELFVITALMVLWQQVVRSRHQ